MTYLTLHPLYYLCHTEGRYL